MTLIKSSIATCVFSLCFVSIGHADEITLQPGSYQSASPGYGLVFEGVESISGQLVFHDIKNPLRPDLLYGSTGNEIRYVKSTTLENVWEEISESNVRTQCPITILSSTTFKYLGKDCPQSSEDFFYSLAH